MNYPRRTAVFTFLCLAVAMPAQEGEKPQPKESGAKAETNAPKDDATTAKDSAVVAIDAFITNQKVDKSAADWRTSLQAPPQQKFDAQCDYFWHVETSVGLVKVRLFADTAPMHVTCGIYLARLGYYDALKFHRIITGFMAQGGCPFGTGRGGPGYTIDGEFNGGRKHDKPGMLSTANTGRPKTDGSQFFLTFVPTPHLDGKHTIWGEVVEGMEALKELEARGNRQGSPTPNSPTIVRTWISVVKKAAEAEKPKDAEKPKEPEKPKDAGKTGK
jgi:cyclophilin family peptidyl-prolyl cis-trans isomerase